MMYCKPVNVRSYNIFMFITLQKMQLPIIL